MLTQFVSEHLEDDTSRLLLSRGRWPHIDMDLAVACIESRRKLKGKVQEWYDNTSLIFPAKLSAEQCSSSATASYKSALAERIASADGWKIADLTGGLGVDSWFFSRRAGKVLYNEMQPGLCKAASHNFKALGACNIEVSNHAVSSDPVPETAEASPSSILGSFSPDVVYMDPARRGEGGKKVFLIEECTPDVLNLKDEIFTVSRHILIKLSPMADISMVCSRLGETCREVHVVAYGGDCKELLIWMDREWKEEYSVHAIELPTDFPASQQSVFTFLPSEEKNASDNVNMATCHCEDTVSGNLPGKTLYLFEPGKALMKAGAFNLVSIRMEIAKLGKSTHYYLLESEEQIARLRGLGKVYRILKCEPLDKRTMKAAGKDFPKAEVTARNIPMDTDTLRKKLGVTSGDDAHIFGLKSDLCGNILLCTKRVLQEDLETHGNEDEATCKFSLGFPSGTEEVADENSSTGESGCCHSYEKDRRPDVDLKKGK